MVDWGRENQIQHIIGRENYVLVFARQAVTDNWSHVQITQSIVDNRFHYSNKGIPIFAPIYLYNENDGQLLREHEGKVSNFNEEILRKIAAILGLDFIHEGGDGQTYFNALNLLDYIYSTLHSTIYRNKYLEFLKVNFPRIPYPGDKETFWKLVRLGSKLRKYHLLEAIEMNEFVTTYPIAGDNFISRKITSTSLGFVKDNNNDLLGKVWINDKQYFENVPKAAWEFYIGGYQPAQKWLKDRVGRQLRFEDIIHYQRMIVSFVNTRKLMEEIDQIHAQ